MDSKKSNLLIALSASAFGAVVLSIAIYKRFFTERDGKNERNVKVEDLQEREVSPPVQFKNKINEMDDEEVLVRVQRAEGSDNNLCEVEEDMIVASTADTSCSAPRDNVYSSESVEEFIVPACQTQVFAEHTPISTHHLTEHLPLESVHKSEGETSPTLTCEKESLSSVSSDVNTGGELIDVMQAYVDMNTDTDGPEGSGDALLSRSQGSDDSVVACSSVADSGIGLPNTGNGGPPLLNTQSSVSAASSDVESDVTKSADRVEDQLTSHAAFSPSNHPEMDTPDANADGSPVEACAADTAVGSGTAEEVKVVPAAKEEVPAAEEQVPAVEEQVPAAEEQVLAAERETAATQEVSQMNGIAEQVVPQRVAHSFLMPESICGRFIGKGGRNISALKHETKTNIKVGRENVVPTFKLCTVEGFSDHVSRAVRLIQKQYPEIDVTAVVAAQTAVPSLTLSADRMQPHLPLGILLDVVISNIVCAGHVFVQQPTHPMFSSWQRMDTEMNHCYGSGIDSPPIPAGCEDGILCVAFKDGRWHRAQVMAFSEDRLSSDIKLVDVGGYACVATSDLRPIRADFLSLPFQAVECYLANIAPVEGEVYTEEADEALRAMTSSQLVQCQPVCNDEHTGIPYIHVICQHDNKMVVANRELANRGLVSWYEMSE